MDDPQVGSTEFPIRSVGCWDDVRVSSIALRGDSLECPSRTRGTCSALLERWVAFGTERTIRSVLVFSSIESLHSNLRSC